MKKKLEVGKTYRTKNGGTVTIISKDDDDLMPFNANNGLSYTEDGQVIGLSGTVYPEVGIDWGPENLTFSPTQVSRLLDALNLARNGCEGTAWEDALVALEEALCPEEDQ